MSEAINPATAPEVPPLPENSKKGFGKTVAAIVYWSLMILGIGIPPVLGIYGSIF